MDQKVIFDKTPFKAALHILKKRYNVDFIVNTSKFDKYTFTGAFTEQYIEEILENFKISSHIRWRNVKLTNNQSEERRQIVPQFVTELLSQLNFALSHRS